MTAFSNDIGCLGMLGLLGRRLTMLSSLELLNWLVAALHNMSARAHQNRKLPSLVTRDWSLPAKTLCAEGSSENIS